MFAYPLADFSRYRNEVRLVGDVRQTPEIAMLPDGRKAAVFSLAVRDQGRDSDGCPSRETQIITVVAYPEAFARAVAATIREGMTISVTGRLRMEDGKAEVALCAEACALSIWTLGRVFEDFEDPAELMCKVTAELTWREDEGRFRYTAGSTVDGRIVENDPPRVRMPISPPQPSEDDIPF